METWKKTAALLLLTTALPVLADGPATIAAPANSAYLEIGAQHTLPQAITVHGQVVKLDRQPLMQENTLYIPLRFIVEAAGGTVAWQAEAQQITVTLPDRTAVFVIGQDQAELNERGVFYIQRNLIKMERPVIVVEGRTMISAEALSKILGMVEQADTDLNMDLVSRPAKGGGDLSTQVVPTAVAASAAPQELQAWAGGLTIEGGRPSYKVVTTESGRYLAIAGGQQPSGGHSIQIVSATLVGGTWVIEAKVVAPTGPAITLITNPVAFYNLGGMTGNVEVKMLSDRPAGKVMEGEAQVTLTAVSAAAVPAEMQSWASGLTVEQGPSFKVTSAADGSYVGIAGGMQPTGGYTIDLIGGQARLVEGTWYIEARVVPPSGMATQVLTNPVAFYHLPGVTGTVQVNFWTNGATP